MFVMTTEESVQSLDYFVCPFFCGQVKSLTFLKYDKDQLKAQANKEKEIQYVFIHDGLIGQPGEINMQKKSLHFVYEFMTLG